MRERSVRPALECSHPPAAEPRLEGGNVTLVYTMYHHLGDFVVMGGLLKKLDLLGVEFESIVAHRDSPYIDEFAGPTQNRFFNVGRMEGLLDLLAKLRRQKREGRLIFGIPMAPGSLQAFCFFWVLKQLGALTHIVDFNLINADVLTPARRRYIFDRHLTQASELFKRPEWTRDFDLPLAIAVPVQVTRTPGRRVAIFPWSGRGHLPEFRWPDIYWLELTNLLLSEPETTVVLLGKDERFSDFETALRRALPDAVRKRFTPCRSATVAQLVAGLREVDLLVTLNTSALHLAHALQLPTLALCGSSAEFWLPEADHIQLVRDTRGVLPPSDNFRHDPLQPSLKNIGVDSVYSAYRELSARCRLDGSRTEL